MSGSFFSFCSADVKISHAVNGPTEVRRQCLHHSSFYNLMSGFVNCHCQTSRTFSYQCLDHFLIVYILFLIAMDFSCVNNLL